MGPGTLYGSIGRMMDAGLIRESAKQVDAATGDKRRVYYEITAHGQRVLAEELVRYRQVVTLAEVKQLTPHSRAYG